MSARDAHQGSVIAKIAAFNRQSSNREPINKSHLKSLHSVAVEPHSAPQIEQKAQQEDEELFDFDDSNYEFDFAYITLESILQEYKNLKSGSNIIENKSVPQFPISSELDCVPGMEVTRADTSRRQSSSAVQRVDPALTPSMETAELLESRLIDCEIVDFVSPLQVKRRLRYQKKTHLAQKATTENENVKANALIASKNVVKVESMETISRQLFKNWDMKENGPGSPTVIAIHSKFIAIGTSRSLVLVFDHFQNIRQVLGTTADAQSDGPVTAIDVSPGSDYLVCGYQSGRVVLWDMIKGSPLKADSESYDSPIVCLRFLKDQKPLLLSIDYNGLVNRVSFSKMMGMVFVVDVDPIYDASAGKILAVSILPQSAPGNTKATSIMDQCCLAALSSDKVTYIVAIEPEVKILYRWARPADISDDDPVLPSLAFAWISFPGSKRSVAPVLARAWGKHVEFMEAILSDGGNSSQGRHGWTSFEKYDAVECLHDIVAIQWLGDQVVVHLNTKDELCVYDVMSKQELEIVDVSALELVFASYRGKNARSFSNSFRGCDSILYLLGLKELQTARVQPWTQLVDSLSQEGEWLAALALALDNYEGIKIAATERAERDRFPPVFFRNKQNDQCLVDIMNMCQTNQRTGEKENVFRQKEAKEDARWVCGEEMYSAEIAKKLEDSLQQAQSGQAPKALVPIGVAERVADLLIEYVQLAISNPPASKSMETAQESKQLDLAKSHYQMLAGVCIEYCAIIDRTDLLFGEIFRQFSENNQTATFIELLEPYILSNRLCGLSAEIMQVFAEHYVTNDKLDQLEQCLLRLDANKVDVEMVLQLCRKYRLYSAMVYICNEGLDDYVKPIDLLLEAINSTHASGLKVDQRAEPRMYGYKLLLYISYSLNGKTFPFNKDIPLVKLNLVRAAIFNHLFAQTFEMDCGHSRLLTLIRLDAKAFLDIIARAFDDPSIEFYGDKSTGVASNSQYESMNATNTMCPTRLSIVLTLSEVIFIEGQSTFGSSVHSHFFMFEARLLSAGSIDAQQYADARVQSMAGVDEVSTQGGRSDNKESMMDSLINYLALGPATFIKSRDGHRSRGSTGSVAVMVPEADGFDKDGRQEMLVRLLQNLDKSSYDANVLLQNVLQSKMNRVAVLLYKFEGNIRSAIGACLDDSDHDYRIAVFNFIRSQVEKLEDEVFPESESNKTSSKRTEIEQAILEYAPTLMEADGYAFVVLILSFFPQMNNTVIQKFVSMGKSGAKLEYLYLREILLGHQEEQDGFSNMSDEDAIRELLDRSNLRLSEDPAVQERFIWLLCEFDPVNVLQYLQSHNGYRVESCLKLCQEYKITDAEAYLLERTGDTTGSLALILQTLEQKLKALKPALHGVNAGTHTNDLTGTSRLLSANAGLSASKESIIETVEQGRDALRTLEVALAMCQRNTLRHQDQQAEKLWFNLLDKLLRIQAAVKRALKKSPASRVIRGGAQTAFQVALNELIRVVLERMVSSVSLKAILFKIVNEHGKDAFGEFRSTIFGILDTYIYEKNICKTANDLISVDLFEQIQQRQRSRLHPYASPSELCAYCNDSLARPPFDMAHIGAMSGEKWNINTALIMVASGQFYHESCGKAWMQGADKKAQAEHARKVEMNTQVSGSMSTAEEDAGTRLHKRQPSTRRYLTRLKNSRKGARRVVPCHVILESLVREDNNRNKYLKNARGINSLRPDLDQDRTKRRAATREPGSLPAEPVQKGGFRC
uniref:Vacuolar protein sortingassociated protein 8 putati n=1 Tax=Albugo laibachii Nc14 TaxID=890382 RepID=F0WHX1_9STRA|nr:vacuolar protein sortingassociated protein 8 putati [Albugo laibachii Nc14]|eukprot:CCA20847.1 vacuolar protein sortingassociated protein 8 putati [Albugo laibachii Nc14]